LITAMSPEIKANSILSTLALSLDTINFIMKGLTTIFTSVTVNSSATCDDAALKVAFIEHKMVVYRHAIVEANTNASTILVQYAYLNSYQYIYAGGLSPTQKANIQTVLTYMNSVLEGIRQDILSLTSAVVRLVQLYYEAKVARFNSCSCNGETTIGTTVKSTLKGGETTTVAGATTTPAAATTTPAAATTTAVKTTLPAETTTAPAATTTTVAPPTTTTTASENPSL
jgi:hypothetical protein